MPDPPYPPPQWRPPPPGWTPPPPQYGSPQNGPPQYGPPQYGAPQFGPPPAYRPDPAYGPPRDRPGPPHRRPGRPPRRPGRPGRPQPGSPHPRPLPPGRRVRLHRRRTGLLLALVVAVVLVVVVIVQRPSGLSHPSVSAAVSGTAGARTLGPDFSGFSTDGSAQDYADQRFLPAVRGLQPESLRGFPAGTGSNYFNWETGRFFMTAKDFSYISPDKPEPADALSLFANAVKGTGTTPVFTLNIMTYCPADPSDPRSTSQAAASCSPQEACGPDPAAYTEQCTNTDPRWGLPFELRLLHTAQQLGLPIKYVELGNELYGTGDPAYYFPTAQDYVRKANVWTAAIKQQFPDVQVGVVGFAGTACRAHRTLKPGQVTRMSGWNAAVQQQLTGANAMIFHTYYDSEIESPGSVKDSGDLATMLSSAAQSCLAAFEKQILDPLPAGLSAWVTEWNLTPTEGVLEHGSWAQGLTEAVYATGLARLPKVALMENETLINTQVYGALFSGVSSHYAQKTQRKTVAVPDAQGVNVEPFARSGGGFALGAFNRSLHGATSTTQITFADAPTVSGTQTPGLIGQTFTVSGKRNLFFVNLSGDDVGLDLHTLAGHYSMDQYSTTPATFIVSEDSVTHHGGTVTGKVLLPAYSVTSLTG